MWKLSAARKDENAWVKVVCAMLSIAGIGSMDDMLEINSV